MKKQTLLTLNFLLVLAFFLSGLIAPAQAQSDAPAAVVVTLEVSFGCWLFG